MEIKTEEPWEEFKKQMNQDQQPRPWWKHRRIVQALWASAFVVPISLLIAVILGGYLWNGEWTGLVGIPQNPETRTAWDWLELLIIPVVLGAGALWFNNRARKSEQELARRDRESDQQIAEDRAREEALQHYLDKMQELILDKGLRRSEKDAEIRDVTRARTLTVLRSLDGNRRGQVVRFLCEADLIGTLVREDSGEIRVVEAIINLRTAELRDANLSGADLGGVNLVFTNLYRTDLRYANLSNASLRDANLSHANLGGATLRGAYLIDARLHDAKLRGADLKGAHLSGAFLIRADLRNANLRNANLRSANLRDAEGWTNEQLAQARSLVGATLPNGTVIRTEEGWEEFKKSYR